MIRDYIDELDDEGGFSVEDSNRHICIINLLPSISLKICSGGYLSNEAPFLVFLNLHYTLSSSLVKVIPLISEGVGKVFLIGDFIPSLLCNSSPSQVTDRSCQWRSPRFF